MKISVKPSIALHVDRPQQEPYPQAETVLDKAVPEARAASEAADDLHVLSRAPDLDDLQVLLDETGVEHPTPPLPDGEEPEPRQEATPVAVFVTHGMGQQLKFATLDMVANGIEKAVERRTAAPMTITDVAARTVRLGSVKTERVEMTVRGSDPSAPPVSLHLYEGYWASLTEGKVTLRDVMAFLYRGAWNGLKKGIGQPLERYMFGQPVLHQVTWSAFLGLLLTALVLGSLILFNTVIGGVVVDSAYGVLNRGEVVTDVISGAPSGEAAAGENTLGSALTGIITYYLLVTLFFGVLLGIVTARATQTYDAAPTPGWRFATGFAWWLGFVPWTLATLAAGVLILAVLLNTVLPDGLMEGRWLLAVLGVSGLLAVSLVAAGISAAKGKKALDDYTRTRGNADPTLLSSGAALFTAIILLLTAVAVLGLIVVALAGGGVTAFFSGNEGGLMSEGWYRALVWSALFGVSALIRNVIVQYFGDVAAYVSSHTLDRFAELRTAIKAAVTQILHELYHHTEHGRHVYEHIGIVGHSLGSVVAYDALNGALNEDERATRAGEGARVQERTKLFLTFGSPLDKTAYIFRGQNQSLSVVREALANAVQPMIRDYDRRVFPWVNVHSKRDIIGSALDLYDEPSWKGRQRESIAKAPPTAKKGDARTKEFAALKAAAQTAKQGGNGALFCVHDIEDEQALVPLVAHNEHWHTAAVFDVLVEAMLAPVLAQQTAAKTTP